MQTYQWYKDGTALTGVASATTATFSLSAVTAADQGSYAVVATGFTSVTSTAFALTVTAPPTTGPATLTVTSFTCYTTAAGLSSVNFVVGYSNGTFAPALPDLFINGVTASGQLGQAYTVSFDANQSTLPIADNATRSTYFVWDFRQACTGPVAPPVPTGPATLTVTSVTCVSTNSVLSSVNFVLGYSNGTFVPALSPLFINGVTASGQLGQVYTLSFDGNQSLLPIADDATRSTYFVWNFRQACTTGGARFAAETDVPWLVAVQGNPTRDDVAVVVTNAQGQSLYLELVDMTGQIVVARKIVPVLGQHREVFDLSRQGTGLLLLRTTGAMRTQTLKVLRN